MEPQVDNWGPSAQTDQETQTSQLPRYIKERTAMWRCGEKEEAEVGRGTEGGREEKGRRKNRGAL